MGPEDLDGRWVRRRPLSFKGLPTWRHPRELFVQSSVKGGRVEGASFAILCPSGCGATVALAGRPEKEGKSWPHVGCTACGVAKRCGNDVCVLCQCTAASCECRVAASGHATRGKVQASIMRFMR